MRLKFNLRGRWKSISIFTKNKQTIIRYWGGLKFDKVVLNASN